jgi:hypothetical protein
MIGTPLTLSTGNKKNEQAGNENNYIHRRFHPVKMAFT